MKDDTPITNAIREALVETIQKLGLSAFKATSWFPSSREGANDDN